MMTTATAGTLRAETRLVLEEIMGRLTAVRIPFRSNFSSNLLLLLRLYCAQNLLPSVTTCHIYAAARSFDVPLSSYTHSKTQD
jgi:hypothetical protein